ncbi:signal peptidase I [Pseudactinotalea sp. HY158]|uniref:signal peptidase I n=1 Tax=Pseudactinotalea sp. HY158 TaxID=2654547 RepID=UPI00129CB97C|nr:signal peptidase I [Pseudactinotalea sp. HY158]QGH68627.1 signal peptidase I [Pseudactinotalea sp. HY158]
MRPRHSSPPPTLRDRAGGLLLNLAAIAGAVIAVLAIAGISLNISIVLFRTGSMGPSIPAGAVALVREVPAAGIEMGDVVTVEREAGQLPVTHRVIEVLGTDAATGETRFRMQGDANAEPDTRVYDAIEVRRVLGSVPGGARIVAALGNPLVLGPITLAAALLVLWAFWPREDTPPAPAGDAASDRDGGHSGHGGSGGHSGHGGSGGRGGHGGRGASVTAVVALAALLHLGPGATVARAAPTPPAPTTPTAPAAPPAPVSPATTQLIEGEYLRLRTVEAPGMRSLTPGESAAWIVGVWAEAPDGHGGRIDVDVRASGVADRGRFSARITSCDIPWRGAACPGEEQVLLAGADVVDLTGRDLLGFDSTEERWLRIDVTLDPRAPQDGSVDLTVRARGFGEEISDDGAHLPATGAGPAWPALAAGLLALTAGAALIRRRTTR